MANDSTGAGYITPASTAPTSDLDLDKLLQTIVIGLTGIEGDNVRPRVQPVVAHQLPASTNWVAVGVTNIRPDDNPAIIHDPTGEGSDILIRHETLDCLATFYGPNGQQYASIFRDGLWLPQNSSFLRQYDAAFMDAGPVRAIPEFKNQQWIRRYDLAFALRRKVTRTYNIRNIASAEIVLTVDEPALTETIDVIGE
jgi:hypothetical protein